MTGSAPAKKILPFVLLGLAVAVCVALFVSPWASDSPDGLNKVAIDKGFSSTERDHALEEGPLSGYLVDGVEDERVSKGLSGLIGVSVTFVVAGAAFLIVRHSRSRRGTS